MTDFFNSIFDVVKTNELAQGGLIFSVGASVCYSMLAIFKTLGLNIWRRITRLFFYEVIIEQSDESYYYLSEWLAEKYPNKFKKVNVNFNMSLGTVYTFTTHKKDDEKSFLVPDNDYILIWKNWFSPIKIASSREKLDNNASTHIYYGRYSISGILNKKNIIDIVKDIEIRHAAKNREEIKQLHRLKYRWSSSSMKYVKDTSKIYNEHVSKIDKHLNKFLKSEKDYIEKGILYKTGILLYGPPGTSKTQTVRSFAKKLNRNLYIFNIARMTDEVFVESLSEVKNNSIVLIDDIDVCVPSRDDESEKSVSLTTLLSFLDGPLSIENIIVFATTNDVDKLDPALRRKGRFDLSLEFGYPKNKDVEEYINNFWGVADTFLDLEKDFFINSKIPMVNVQDICLSSESVYDTLQNLKGLDTHAAPLT